MQLTDTEFYTKYTTEYNQIILEELQSQEDTGSTLIDDMCSFGGCMYETYGKEFECVMAQPRKRIWTIVDNGDNLIIIADYHIVDSFGYLVTNEEWNGENEQYVID